MSEIRAFVGHSFTEDDADIVDKFLKYFDQVKGLHSAFSWQHAEAAEPKELATKVLALIADKNVFIGICTKKERVATPGALKAGAFWSAYKKVKDTDLEWKTSDWIIQEIGLAKGLNLDLILLVEDGVRRPGGLQGNVEYITFRREAPEKSYGKILEMVQALSPKPSQAGTTIAEMPSKDAEGPQIAADVDDKPDRTTPLPQWTTRQYIDSVFQLLRTDRPEDAAKVEVAYLDTAEAKIGDNKIEWQATTEWFRLVFGKGGSLEKLVQLADANPKNQTVLYRLGLGFQRYDNAIQAAKTFEAAATVAKGDADKRSMLAFAAVARARSGDTSTALSILEELRRAASANPKAERDVLDCVLQVSEVMKDDDAMVAAMERIVEIAPSDIDARFQLAFKHGEMENEDLALHHYLKIPTRERRASTWNNLGVAFDSFTMPANSVQSYHASAKRGGTLAMSNLSNKLIGAGFLKEAQEQLDKALAIEKYHKNVGTSLARLKEVPDQEEDKQKELLDGAKPKAEFYNLLGHAISKPAANMGVRWSGPDCELVVAESGNKIAAVGYYEREAGGLSGLFGAPGTPSAKSERVKYKLEYELHISGSAMQGEVRRGRHDSSSLPQTVLGSDGTITSKVLIAACEGGILKALESPHSANPKFYDLRIVQQTA